jgi:receptor tyrosine kinase-like orphan receptor 2
MFPFQNLRQLAFLGEGQYGRVLKMAAVGLLEAEQTTEVAVKMLHDNATAADELDFRAEISLALQVQHPNIVTCLGACTAATTPLCLILELTPLGSLKSHLQSHPTLRPEDQVSLLYQIAQGMAALHMKFGIVHRDLATRNVLLFPDLQAKITDFGLARQIRQPPPQPVATSAATGAGNHSGTNDD